MIRKDPNLTKKHNIQWFGPHLAGDEVLYLERCLTNNYINDGILSRQVEQEISNFLGVKYALTVTNGTSALAVSLMALGIGVGDEVLVPNFTFAATANAVLMTGAKPILTDISEENFCISIESIQRVQTPSTKAVIAVELLHTLPALRTPPSAVSQITHHTCHFSQVRLGSHISLTCNIPLERE